MINVTTCRLFNRATFFIVLLDLQISHQNAFDGKIITSIDSILSEHEQVVNEIQKLDFRLWYVLIIVYFFGSFKTRFHWADLCFQSSDFLFPFSHFLSMKSFPMFVFCKSMKITIYTNIYQFQYLFDLRMKLIWTFNLNIQWHIFIARGLI